MQGARQQGAGQVRPSGHAGQAHGSPCEGRGASAFRPWSPRLLFSGALRKLMSYNAQNFFRTRDGRLMKDDQSVQALADAIRREDPDVIAFQEVGDQALLREFNEKFLAGKYPHVVSFPVGRDRSVRVAMMSKANIRVAKARSHWQEQNASAKVLNRRDFLEASFLTETGYRFTVYTGHFKSMEGGEQETMPIRLAEAKSAAKIVRKQLRRDPQAPLLVVGDFNMHAHTKSGALVLNTLSLRRSRDPARRLTEVLGWEQQPAPTRVATKSHAECKLDYIFASPAMLTRIVKAYVAGVFKQDPWCSASDHLPVVAVFEEPDELPAMLPGPKPARKKPALLA
jgi:endonuclease/exonuclease/phosphatase family metal-dependent hydrolase